MVYGDFYVFGQFWDAKNKAKQSQFLKERNGVNPITIMFYRVLAGKSD